jgi:hypothetical protein
MPEYDFTFRPRKPHTAGKQTEPNPSIPQKIPGVPDKSKDSSITYDPTNLNTPEDVRTILPKGFHAIDEGVKNYFIDLKVPTKDSVRDMMVRVAGGDKTYLFWKQNFESHRIKLPVMSINRTGLRWDQTRYSPPFIPMTRHFTVRDGSRMALVYRPWPCLVDYALAIWAERKRDAEYALYQIITRFNPFAETMVEFDTLKGHIRGKLGEVTDSSDIDIGAEELPKVRYDITTTWEAWLPLPEKVVPTILGRVGIVVEDSGVILDIAEFNESGGLNAGALVGQQTPSPIEEDENG